MPHAENIGSSGRNGPRSYHVLPKEGLSFMKRISDFCMRMSLSEVHDSDESGIVRFVANENGRPVMLKKGTEITGDTVRLRTSTVLKRAWSIAKNHPNFPWNTPVEHVELGSNDVTDDGRSLRHLTVKRTQTTVGAILAEAKNSFHEQDKVQSVERLSVGDRTFVTFEGDAELYSITVRESSRKVGGTDTALCDVTYRAREKGSGKVVERQVLAVMYLPLTVGAPIRATESGKLLREISGRIVRKIQIRHHNPTSGQKK